MTGCSFLAIRRDTVDVDLTFSAQVGKSWGTKMIGADFISYDNNCKFALQVNKDPSYTITSFTTL